MRLVVIFLAEFFFSLHFAATLYINSSFLEHFFGLQTIGILYVAGALGNAALFLLAPRLLNKFGTRGFLFLFLFFTLGSTIGAAYAFGPYDAAIFFLIYASVSTMVYYALDIMLEEDTANRKTGEIRGIYLTLANIAFAAGPILITLLGTDEKFKYFYLAAALLLLPLIILVLFFLRSKHPRRKYTGHSLPFLLWWKRKAVRRVTFARFILEFFFGMMAIYTPIYLHGHIGFSWTEIGVIFSIMLLPFIIFEWPAGILADRFYGEREIMSWGFFITFVSLLFIPGLGKEAIPWAVALFFTRVGASVIEITTESYFFKHVSSNDSGLISIFRLSRSAGLIFGAAAGALAIASLPFYSIYIILAFAVLLGLRESMRLVDTK
ncbi:MFS transporter [Candidatus Parcubacteria bacterium]|nr:MFS transporter [Candidatus Parcubacteria bacterium]